MKITEDVRKHAAERRLTITIHGARVRILVVLALVAWVTLKSSVGGAENRIISGPVTLETDETWAVSNLELKADSEIRTNGHRLTVKVDGDLRADEGALATRIIFPHLQ
jgi:hypothetical protein